MRAAKKDVPLDREDRAAAGARAPRRDPRRGRRRHGGARRSRAGVSARADPADPEGDHRARARARPAGDPRHAGARVDADRAAADARRSQRRRDRGRPGRRRDHAVGGNGGRRLSRSGRSRRSSAIIADAETVATPAALLAADVLLDGRDTTKPLPTASTPSRRVHGRAMCEAAVTLASTGQAEAIVAVTRLGKTAQLLSSLRPRASILAVTPSEAVARRLKLYWGVRPIVSDLEDLRALEDADPAPRELFAARRGRRLHQHQPGSDPSGRELPERPATVAEFRLKAEATVRCCGSYATRICGFRL